MPSCACYVCILHGEWQYLPVLNLHGYDLRRLLVRSVLPIGFNNLLSKVVKVL